MPNSSLVRGLTADTQTSGLRVDRIASAIQVACELLPANGSLRHFRHHNPLRAFETLPFDQAVNKAARLRGAMPYRSEHYYCQMLKNGQMDLDDLSVFLKHDLGCTAEDAVAGLVSRVELRTALIKLRVYDTFCADMPQNAGSTEFHAGTPPNHRKALLEDIHQCLNGRSDETGNSHATIDSDAVGTLKSLVKSDRRIVSGTSQDTKVCLEFLSWVCHRNLGAASPHASAIQDTATIQPEQLRRHLLAENFASVSHNRSIRHRDLLIRLTSIDTDQMVHAVLVPFLSGFLDQGQVKWGHDNRDTGLLRKFADIYVQRQFAERRWLKSLSTALQQLQACDWDALKSIEDSLTQLGISEAGQSDYLAATMLALSGWTGMVHYLEQGAEWMTWPVPSGTLHELVALRLILDRLAAEYTVRNVPGFQGTLSDLATFVTQSCQATATTDESTTENTATVYRLAQVLGWTPSRLCRLTSDEWRDLACEVQSFSRSERLRCFQSAYEERYRRQTLDAVSVHATQHTATSNISASRLQVICCTDTCAESLRRHLEESCASCETFGTPGFFGLAINFRALGETHFSPHCPANVKSRHYVQEVPGLNTDGTSQRNPRARVHQPGKSPFRTLELSSLLENWLSTPRLTRLLFPRITRRLGRFSVSQWQTPRAEQLDWESTPHGLQGYSLDEMVDAVQTLLTDIGLIDTFAPIVLLVGHVSISVNNPFSAADNCAFCSGRSSGANARTMALMANDHRVRAQLKLAGLTIPDSTVFVAGEHDTCGDTVEYFDLTQLSLNQKDQLPFAIDMMDEALRRNAHERCRRFENVSLQVTREQAAALVEDRTMDLTESCAEHSHSANAICVVGRRERTKGLFLDRRAFLASYDPDRDDEDGSNLSQLLKTVIPTCLSVNLQYYFSAMDPGVYGAGSKLRHSVVSMLGVTETPFDDLCVGLPEQMTRMHEPQRLLCIIETSPKTLRLLLEQNLPLRRWCDNEWLFLATLDPASNRIHHYRRGEFHRYETQRTQLPEVGSSEAWYRGLRENLSCASISAHCTLEKN